jgi:hypothetical protein
MVGVFWGVWGGLGLKYLLISILGLAKIWVMGEQRVRFRLARKILQTLCSFFGGKRQQLWG